MNSRADCWRYRSISAPPWAASHGPHPAACADAAQFCGGESNTLNLPPEKAAPAISAPNTPARLRERRQERRMNLCCLAERLFNKSRSLAIEPEPFLFWRVLDVALGRVITRASIVEV
jgi:hypothetical protein